MQAKTRNSQRKKKKFIINASEKSLKARKKLI